MPFATLPLLTSAGYLEYNSVYRDNLTLNFTPSSYIGSGTTWDNTQNSTDATLFNTPSYNINQGFTFNGINEYGTIPNVNNITSFTSSQNYTVELWLNVNSVQQDTARPNHSIFEKWNTANQSAYPYVVRYSRADNRLYFACYNGSSNPSVSVFVPTDTWFQVVGVFNHATNILSVYLNGSFATSGSINLSGVNNTSTVQIGRRGNTTGGGTNYFTGSIGIIRVYSVALTDSEVLGNFNDNRSQYGI